MYILWYLISSYNFLDFIFRRHHYVNQVYVNIFLYVFYNRNQLLFGANFFFLVDFSTTTLFYLGIFLLLTSSFFFRVFLILIGVVDLWDEFFFASIIDFFFSTIFFDFLADLVVVLLLIRTSSFKLHLNMNIITLNFITTRNIIINYSIIIFTDIIHNFINCIIFYGRLLNIFLGWRLSLQHVSRIA